MTGSLDLTQFYWQIPVTAQYGKIFTTSTFLGTHTPQVVQQGDMCAVRAAQVTISKIIEGIPGVAALLDDIVITAPDPDTFLDRLEMVLQRLQDCADPNYGPGIKIRGDKFVILSDNISYMGLKIIRGQLYADTKKAEKILEWKVPGNLTELQSYCSFISYFRIFFRNTSTKIAPILDLEKIPKYTKKQHWKQEHQEIFDKVKTILTTLPALKIIDTSPTGGTLHVFHDWSTRGYGGLLAQEVTDPATNKTSLRPIQYFSRLAKKSELRYKVSEGEMNSAIAAIQKWQHYLRGKEFILHSDSSVVYHVLKNYKNTSRVLSRLASEIQGMCFKVKHISTKESPADYFSRLVVDEERICNINKFEPNIPHLTPSGDVEERDAEYETETFQGEDDQDFCEDEDEDYEEEDAIMIEAAIQERKEILLTIKETIDKMRPYINNAHHNDKDKLITNLIAPATTIVAPVTTRAQKKIGDTVEDVPELLRKQREDLYLDTIAEQLLKSKRQEATFEHGRYTYKLVKGILLACYDDGPYKYVAPKSMQRDIVVAKHGLVHCGVAKTLEQVRATWIFPGLNSLVRQVVKQCYRCQAFGSNPKYPDNPHNPLQHLKAKRPNDIIAIDVWSSGKQDSRFKYVIAAIDLFSRFLWTRCLQRATSEAISDFLLETVFTTGVPRRILSDNAENISAGCLPYLYKAVNIGFAQANNSGGNPTQQDDGPRISQETSTAYWPMGNAVIERIFRNIGDWLRKIIANHPEEFHKYIPVTTLIYNTTTHRALDTTPMHLHFGIKPTETTPDVYDLLAFGGYNSPNHYIKERARDCQKARVEALHHMNREGGYYEDLEIDFNRRNDVRWHSFTPGDWVMVHRPPDNRNKLGSPYFMGPATITELVGRNGAIVEYWANGVKKKRNVKHLKMFYYDPEDTEAHKLFSGPKKKDHRLDADGHKMQEIEDEFLGNGIPEDQISWGLQDPTCLPVIVNGEDETAEDDEIEDESPNKQVRFTDKPQGDDELEEEEN